jgi:hypothetical protein
MKYYIQFYIAYPEQSGFPPYSLLTTDLENIELFRKQMLYFSSWKDCLFYEKAFIVEKIDDWPKCVAENVYSPGFKTLKDIDWNQTGWKGFIDNLDGKEDDYVYSHMPYCHIKNFEMNSLNTF